MKLTRLLLSTTITLTSLSVGMTAFAFTITQTNNGAQLLDALLGNTDGLSNFNISLFGDARGFGIYEDDPFYLEDGVVMSTGRVIDLPGVNTSDTFSPDLNTDFGLPGNSGDSLTLQLTFDADDTAEKFYFQYAFGSEEFVEYGGSSFNDTFTLKLNGIDFARLSDGEAVTINNLVGSPVGPFHPDFIQNPVGTGPASDITKLDGYTFPLLFEAPIVKNATNVLTINMRDTNDGIYDAAVFIKGDTVGSEPPEGIVIDGETYADPDDNGDGGVSVPEPASILGLVTMAIAFKVLFKPKSA